MNVVRSLKCVLFLLVAVIVVSWTSICSAQYNRPWGWGWNRNYMPYQTQPPYPGAMPLYYDGNIPVYDYSPNTGPKYRMAAPAQVQNIYEPSARRQYGKPMKKAGDFNNDGKADKILPGYVKVTPFSSESTKASEKVQSNLPTRAERTWKTKKGDVYEGGTIFGFIDGQVGIRTSDGKRHYVYPNELDAESQKAFEEWQRHKK